MTKGLLGGMTNYSHQSFSAILDDLERERKNTQHLKKNIENNIDILTDNCYWTKNVPIDFRSIINFALTHYTTAIDEFHNLIKDIKKDVKENHINRLTTIAETSHEINERIGKIWLEDYIDKEYGNVNFERVETIYENARDLAVNLLDIQNSANKLKGFVGYKSKKPFSYGKFLFWAAAIAGIVSLIFGDNLWDRFFNNKGRTDLMENSHNNISTDTANSANENVKASPSAEHVYNNSQQTKTPKKKITKEENNTNEGVNYGNIGGNNNQSHVVQGNNYGINGNLHINEVRDLNEQDKQDLLVKIEKYYQDRNYQGEKCFGISVLLGSNGSKTAKQIEEFLISQGFRLSARGTMVDEHFDGVRIDHENQEGCVMITVGNL